MHQVDPKDGYSVSDCRVDRNRRLLEFLIPIVHPNKPTRVTITIGNTIFSALDGGREVDWRVVFRDMMQRLAKGVGKPKPTFICPFLFHIYEGQGLLIAEGESGWTRAPPTFDLDCRDRTRDFRIRPRTNVFRGEFGKLLSSFPFCNPFSTLRTLLGVSTFVLITSCEYLGVGLGCG